MWSHRSVTLILQLARLNKSVVLCDKSSESSRKRLGILIARPPRPVYSPLGDGGVPPEARSSGVNCVEKADQQGGLEDVDEESSMTHVSGVAASC